MLCFCLQASEALAALQQSEQSRQSLKQDLQHKEEEAAKLEQDLDASRRDCDSRQAALYDKEVLVAALQRDLEARNQEILQLKESLDAEEQMKMNGKELMTFKGTCYLDLYILCTTW